MELNSLTLILLAAVIVCTIATYLVYKQQGKSNFVYGVAIVTAIVFVLFCGVGLTTHHKNSKYINAYNDICKHAKALNDIANNGYIAASKEDKDHGVGHHFDAMKKDLSVMKENNTGKYNLISKAESKRDKASEPFEDGEMPVSFGSSAGSLDDPSLFKTVQ